MATSKPTMANLEHTSQLSGVKSSQLSQTLKQWTKILNLMSKLQNSQEYRGEEKKLWNQWIVLINIFKKDHYPINKNSIKDQLKK